MICVRGYTYHCDTAFMTSAKIGLFSSLEREGRGGCGGVREGGGGGEEGGFRRRRLFLYNFTERGDYSRDANNRGTAIIRGN